MSERLQCEFSLIRYVPDVVKGEFVNIGVMVREVQRAESTLVRFTRDWGRVRCFDSGVDVELLQSLENEFSLKLVETSPDGVKSTLTLLDESLSNSLQMTEVRGTLAESLPAELELLMRMYVEPLKASAPRKKQSARAAIVEAMRGEFERAGVWRLMRKRIAVSQYTQAGDPLKIDCGYRNGKVRMFHAVSLENDVEVAKGLAYSAAALREGVARVDDVELELTAVVETRAGVADGDRYGFGVSVMEREAVRVLTVAELSAVADVARRELRV